MRGELRINISFNKISYTSTLYETNIIKNNGLDAT